MRHPRKLRVAAASFSDGKAQMLGDLVRKAIGRARRTVQGRPGESPIRVDEAETSDCQVNVYNFKKLQLQPPSKFGTIRFDPNNDCNLRCVYCHNHRSKEVIDTEEFRAFIHHNVVSTRDFQVGCIMEPTLDSRLADLLLMVADSPAKPQTAFLLQTNGILLHRHDYDKMKDAGLDQLQVSLDTADPGTQRSLRSGMSLQKVLRNIEGFRRACPEIEVVLVATVTSENVGNAGDLIPLGLDVGARTFVFREVFYHPENNVVDHARMPGLLLKPGDFSAMREKILERFAGSDATFLFADENFLDKSAQKMLKDSGRE
jgi:sulfatase maturation enzyme AslB (radical SAM superfamily)